MKQKFFIQKPPRTAGREQFGREFVKKLIQLFKNKKNSSANKEDIVATATAFTAASITSSLRKFVLPRNPKLETPNYRDLVVSGGGTLNPTLMRMIAQQVLPLGLRLLRSDDLGMPAEAKEAAAFALLAYQSWHRQPGNLPSATGARRPAILGKISFP